jgi:folylpolyglutamate synthase/dihydropteroate synthase
VVAVRSPGDEPFFREWVARRPGQRRSLTRARALGRALGLFDGGPIPPVLTVVGSKGKGTAVAHATSVLAAAGLRVGTITSPPFRTNRERVRLDGAAIGEAEYDELARAVAAAMATLPGAAREYLAPTGAFTVAGASLLVRRRGVDVLVLEEGLGGLSDEVSLFDAESVAVTPIFAEHLGILGESVAEIARDLLGVIGPQTRGVTTAPQAECVLDVLAGRRHDGLAVRVLGEVPEVFAATVPGLGAANAAVGSGAGARLAHRLGRPVAEADAAAAAARVRLPGRLSLHPPTPGRAGPWVVDAAINGPGVRRAVQWCTDGLGPPGLVLACFPDTKDAADCYAQFAGLDVVPVIAGADYLTYEAMPGLPAPQAADPALRSADPSRGPVLCVGTMSFIGAALHHLRAPTTAWW